MKADDPGLPERKTLNWPLWAGFLLGIFGLSILLARVSSASLDFSSWLSFTLALLLASGILLAGWWALRGEKLPRWLGALLLGAALLRLAAGVFWFTAIPQWGHNTPAEQAGYIMADASARDQTAWNLAESKKTLWNAFQGQRKVDQYGGMLFISASGLPIHRR